MSELQTPPETTTLIDAAISDEAVTISGEDGETTTTPAPDIIIDTGEAVPYTTSVTEQESNPRLRENYETIDIALIAALAVGGIWGSIALARNKNRKHADSNK